LGTANSVAVASIAAGLAHLTNFALTQDGSRYTWAVLMETGDKYTIHERHSNPCYGEMRPYATGPAKNGPYEPKLFPVEQRKVHKPGDLFWPFPEGTPIALAVPLYGEDFEWLFNAEISPWRSVLKDVELVYKADTLRGIVIKDTNVDPTVMVNLFRTRMNHYCYNYIKSQDTKYGMEIDRIVDCLIPHGSFKTCGVFGFEPDIDLILSGKPNDLSDGGTFKQRYAYNRPKQDYLWKGSSFKKVIEKITGKKGEYITLKSEEILAIKKWVYNRKLELLKLAA
jgi:hypothetical protein